MTAQPPETHSHGKYNNNGNGWYWCKGLWMPVKQPWQLWVRGSHETTEELLQIKIKYGNTKLCVYDKGYIVLTVWHKQCYFTNHRANAIPAQTHRNAYISQKCTDRWGRTVFTKWYYYNKYIFLHISVISLYRGHFKDTHLWFLHSGKPTITCCEKTEPQISLPGKRPLRWLYDAAATKWWVFCIRRFQIHFIQWK